MSAFEKETTVEGSDGTTTITNSLKSSGNGDQPSFDRDIHILTPLPTEEERVIFEEMKQKVQALDLYQNHASWAHDRQLVRFLVARNYNLEASLKLITEALEWREKRKPHHILANLDEWNAKLAKECETGKIYCPGMDRWGRSIVVFNNEAQNTKSAEDHMNFLAWSLEFASSLLDEEVADKYVIFCILSDFSLFSSPSFSETVETIQMLTRCFPERLGHFICYQAPAYFRVVFSTVRSLLDQKTVNKMVFVSGDISDGSKNDLLMKDVLGNDWKILSGVDQPVLVPNSSPGYDHKKYWPTVIERVEMIKSGGSSRNTSTKEKGRDQETTGENIDEEVVKSLDGLVM